VHILLLSAGKVLKTPFGGEDIFTRLLGKWLAQMHHEVTLMGIEFAGIRVRHLTYDNLKDERIIKVQKKARLINLVLVIFPILYELYFGYFRS
jgi:hypothetical protein